MCNGKTQPINILLVEDDRIDAKAFLRAIQQQRISNPVTVAQDGVEAKFLILDGTVKVNGEMETRRGRKLRVGDRVEIQGETFEVITNY